MLHEIHNNKLVKDQLSNLLRAIKGRKVFEPPNLARFVFLCGANKSGTEISERRRALIEFSQSRLPDTHFFLAERMFKTLADEGHKDNLLDVEHLISEFSDYVLIVLESPSAFAELGAFSAVTLRNKLVIINDTRFADAKSFINLGPIKAISESLGSDRIISYRMNDDGVHHRDAIGDTFFRLHRLFSEPIRTKSKPIEISTIDPSRAFDKYSAMFLHDLIYFSGPVLHREIIEILVLLFGKSNFKHVLPLLAILCSFESIGRDSHSLYRSNLPEPYFRYKVDLQFLIATFRNLVQRHYRERVYAH